MERLIADVRLAVRRLGRMRGVAAVIVLTLGVAVGAATAVFSVAYAALLRPLPFDEPDRLAMLFTTRTDARRGVQRTRWSRRDIEAIGPRLTSFEDVASFTRTSVSLADGDAPEQIEGELVSGSYFSVLRVGALRGRVFGASDDTEPGAAPIALISARFWRGRFASDPQILGRLVTINDVPLTIVGVMPDGFAGLSGRAEIWIPATMAPLLTYADYLRSPQHFIVLIGRLKPGIPMARADAELAALAPHIVTADDPAESEQPVWGGTVWPLGRARIDPAVRRSALLLLGAAAVLLLIGCANVASVLLAHARTRRREIAIRLAIGSTRARIVRQLLTESLVLACLGGALGALFAVWSMDLLLMPDTIVPGTGYVQVGAFARPALDRAVLLFLIGLTMATTLAFGLAPALEGSRPALLPLLKEDGRTAAGRRGTMLPALVTAEVSLAVVLLAGSGLLLKSLSQMRATTGEFTAEGVVSFWVNPPASRYADTSGPAIVERMLARVQAVPGVRLAAVNRCTPFSTTCARTIVFFADRLVEASRAPVVGRHYVSADYFRTLGIPLRRGRVLTEHDRVGQPPVAVINETAAGRFWPGEDPIGKRVWFGSGTGFMSRERPVEIVGIVADVKYGASDEPIGPDFYTSYLQFSYPSTMIAAKLDAAAPASIAALRAAIASVDPALAVYDVRTLDERKTDTLSRPRYNAALVAVFAGAALFLAAIGVYGVMAHSVSMRTQEIGVRVALGADSSRVIRMILGDGARLAGAGAALGLVVAAAGGGLLRSLLYGVAPADPAVLAGVTLLMLMVALAAAWLPARRATRVDPVIVLRGE